MWCICAPLPALSTSKIALSRQEVEALATPVSRNHLVHEGIVLESLASKPIVELGGVQFSYLARQASLHTDGTAEDSLYIGDTALWTGELFHLEGLDDGVDGVSVIREVDSSITVYLFQVRSQHGVWSRPRLFFLLFYSTIISLQWLVYVYSLSR